MADKKLQHKALEHSDDIAAFSAAVVGLAGILGLLERFDITGDDLAMALGFSFTIVAFVRGRLEKAYRAFLQGGRFGSDKDASPKNDA